MIIRTSILPKRFFLCSLWKNASLSLGILFLALFSFGQTQNTNPSNSKQKHLNNFYSYNYELFSLDAMYQNMAIDTLNFCRVKMNGIKSVTIYKFQSLDDSIKLFTKEYFENGMTDYLMETLFSYKIKYISCDSLVNLSSANSKTAERHLWTKETWITDSLGYVVEYRFKRKGFLNRWFHKNAFDLYNRKTIYEYDSLYLSVKEYSFWSNNYKFRNCKTSSVYEYNLDSMGNLLSEMKYKIRSDGSHEFVSGYKYFYEFY